MKGHQRQSEVFRWWNIPFRREGLLILVRDMVRGNGTELLQFQTAPALPAPRWGRFLDLARVSLPEGADSGPRLPGRVLYWPTIRGGLTAAGAMFGHHFHGFVFIGADSDTSPIRKHEPMIGTNFLDCVFSHFSAQPAENLRIHGRRLRSAPLPLLGSFQGRRFRASKCRTLALSRHNGFAGSSSIRI